MSDAIDLEILGEDEVRQRLQDGKFGTPGNPIYSTAEGWLRGKEREREEGLNARREAREKESLSISRRAFWVSVIAIIVSIAALVISIMKGALGLP